MGTTVRRGTRWPLHRTGHEWSDLIWPARLHQPDALLALLHRAGGDYIESRLPSLVAGDQVLVDKVAALLASPREGFPPALVDALHQVDEVAHAEGLGAMLSLAEERGIELRDLPAEATPGDVAVRLWLVDPDSVERVHAEQSIERWRTFGPCVAELPVIAAAMDGPKQRAVVLLSIDEQPRVAERALRRAVRRPPPWTSLWGGPDASGQLDVRTVPTAFLVGADGRIDRVVTGHQSAADWTALLTP